MEQHLALLEKNINDEVSLYRELENLYKEKQDILVHRKLNELLEVDSKITFKFECIKPLVEVRNEIFSGVSNSEISMSKIIEESRKVDFEQSKRFENLKEEINSLTKSLMQLDQMNLELIKFGMRLTNKTMQIILNNVNIPTSEYNSHGKVNNQEILQLSSVSEEV